MKLGSYEILQTFAFDIMAKWSQQGRILNFYRWLHKNVEAQNQQLEQEVREDREDEDIVQWLRQLHFKFKKYKKQVELTNPTVEA